MPSRVGSNRQDGRASKGVRGPPPQAHYGIIGHSSSASRGLGGLLQGAEIPPLNWWWEITALPLSAVSHPLLHHVPRARNERVSQTELAHGLCKHRLWHTRKPRQREVGRLAGPSPTTAWWLTWSSPAISGFQSQSYCVSPWHFRHENSERQILLGPQWMRGLFFSCFSWHWDLVYEFVWVDAGEGLGINIKGIRKELESVFCFAC